MPPNLHPQQRRRIPARGDEAQRYFSGHEALEAGGSAPTISAPSSHEALPATWRGMTGMDANRPIATIGFMLFDGTMIDLVLSDLDLERMVRQVVETVPQGWARPHVSLFHAERSSGRLAEDGSMPRGVGLQSPESNIPNTSSGERA